MTQRLRELTAAVVLVAVALAGLAFDAVRSPVGAPTASPPAAGFVQRATFCPPPVEASGSGTQLVVASERRADVPLTIDPGDARTTLRAGSVEVRAAGGDGAAITGLGARVVAGAISSLPDPELGAGAAACSWRASASWYFAEGSSALGDDGRLLLVNPFLDEAILRVVFHTRRGAIAKASLADVAVPPGRALQLAANDFVLRERLLSTSVHATRGRVVAWREQLPARRERPGVQMTLGAPAPATTWYFPDGDLGPGYDERITVLNPSTREAVVSVTVSSSDRLQTSPRLADLSIAPESSRRVRLATLIEPPPRATKISAAVVSTNGVPVVVERTTSFARRGREGEASEVGATRPARAWVLPPAAARPSEDSIQLMNPGRVDALASVRLLAPAGDGRTPKALRRVRVPAGLRVDLPLERWTRGRALAAMVVADEPLVAERAAYVAGLSDAAAVMGVAVTPSAPFSTPR